MVRQVPDRTGRFSVRPHFGPGELDKKCERIIFSFLMDRYSEIIFPISTEDLTCLIERDVEDLDQYADLTNYGPDVEGLTEWLQDKIYVKISGPLHENTSRENRLRTTLAHEYGHVHFHTELWKTDPAQLALPIGSAPERKQYCKRDTIQHAGPIDWMEWQAGYASGAFLMPISHVHAMVKAYKTEHRLSEPIDYTSKHGRRLITMVQTTYQVSAEAAKVRLLKLNILAEPSPSPSLFSL